MMRVRAFIDRLGRAREGVAAVEFALLACFFFGVVTVALDFGAYMQQKLRLGEAVEEGAILAFNTRDAVDPSVVASFLQTAAGLASAPTITCNGTTCKPAAQRGTTDYRCINGTTGAVETTAYALGAACAGGGNAGYYMKIVAAKNFKGLAVPDRWLAGGRLQQTVIVRLA